MHVWSLHMFPVILDYARSENLPICDVMKMLLRILAQTNIYIRISIDDLY